MERRDLLKSTLMTGAALGLGAVPVRRASGGAAPIRSFKLKYAPHLGMFEHSAGKDPVDQIQFMADQGFTAFEDNRMPRRTVADQERIARALERHGMTMGVFVAEADFERVTFASDAPEMREELKRKAHAAVEVAKRVGARWATVVPGRSDPGLEWDYQTLNVVNNLKRFAEILEPSGLVMVLEPLNPWTNHPGCFLTKIPQAYLICQAVGSPSCRILFDMYHQQITEGNIMPNIDRAWEPGGVLSGRRQPGTQGAHHRGR